MSKLPTPTYLLVATVIITSLHASISRAADTPPLRLKSVRMIWDAGKHNAFTDLTRYKDRWLCTFREASAHVSKDGAVRVIASDDAVTWKPLALLHGKSNEDLRELKFAHVPDGRLMLIGAACEVNDATTKPTRGPHHSYVWISDDGENWSAPTSVGDENVWMWRAVWTGRANQHNAEAAGYSFGYGTVDDFLRLYRATDPTHWETLIDRACDQPQANEFALIFSDAGAATCLLRRDGPNAMALLGTASPPYEKWQWKPLDKQIGGPAMIQLPGGELLAAVRLHNPVRTSLCWVDAEHLKLVEALKLPSGGDCSYPGIVLHDGRLYVSYYSSHEGKAKIYLAEVEISK